MVGRMDGDTPRCARPGCPTAARPRTSGRGRPPRYCAQHVRDSQRRAAAAWKERQALTVYGRTAAATHSAAPVIRTLRQARHELEQLGQWSSTTASAWFGLDGALRRRPLDEALLAARARAADRALAAVVAAWGGYSGNAPPRGESAGALR